MASHGLRSVISRLVPKGRVIQTMKFTIHMGHRSGLRKSAITIRPWGASASEPRRIISLYSGIKVMANVEMIPLDTFYPQKRHPIQQKWEFFLHLLPSFWEIKFFKADYYFYSVLYWNVRWLYHQVA